MIACLMVCFGRHWLSAAPNSLARMAISERLPDKAMDWISWSEWIAGPTAESQLLLARANRKLGRWDAVHDHLIRARELGGSEMRIQREDWLAKAQSGQMMDVEYRRNQLLLDPQGDSEEICEAWVHGYLVSRRFDEAMQLLQSWSADYPENPQPHYLMGLTYGERGQIPLAITSLQRAVELDRGYFPARLALANALLDSRKAKEALEEFQKCDELTDDPEVDIGLAKSHLALGAIEEAHRELEQGVARFPNHFRLRLELGRYLMNDDAATALIHAEEACRIDPRNAEARYVLAQILLRLGRKEDAQSHLEYVKTANEELARMQKCMDTVLTETNNVEARFQIGVIQLKYGTELEGLQWLQSVLTYDPGHKEANAALASYYESRASESAEFGELASRYRRTAMKEPD
jgi:tetratricopeptide (TPR) repeat protein